LTLQPLPQPLSVPFTHRAFYDDAPDVDVEIAATSPLGVLGGARSITTQLRVDSGADTTMLHDGYARYLGIDLDQCPLVPVRGLSDENAYRLALVDMYLCDQWLEVPVVFAPNRWPQLLGRETIFDNLSVTFSYLGLGINPFVAMGRL
jgi:hypothetical protein